MNATLVAESGDPRELSYFDVRSGRSSLEGRDEKKRDYFSSRWEKPEISTTTGDRGKVPNGATATNLCGFPSSPLFEFVIDDFFFFNNEFNYYLNQREQFDDNNNKGNNSTDSILCEFIIK